MIETGRNPAVTLPEPSETPFRQSEAKRPPCSLCGRSHAKGRFQTGCPGPRLRTGEHSDVLARGGLPQQVEAVAALAERQAEIEADLGCALALSRVHRDAIRDLLRLELVSDYLFARLTREGPISAKGRTRAALNGYLAVVDRITALRKMIGLARRTKPVGSLADEILAQPEAR